MKKLLALSLLLIISSTSFAQVWIDTGAIWHYNWSNIGYGGFIRIEYNKDTLINEHLCQKLTPIQYTFQSTGPQTYYLQRVDTLASHYTYVNGDTVFKFSEDHFNVFFNFGAQIGDSWVLTEDSTNYGCGPTTVTVESIGTININNYDYRWISLTSSPGSGYAYDGKIVERFGPINDYFFGHLVWCHEGTAEFDWYSFSCFEDESFPLYNVTSKDCEYLLSIGEEKDFNHQIRISPNPSMSFVEVSLNSLAIIKSYSVVDLNGREVLTGDINKSSAEINMDKLEKGIYSIRIITGENVVYNSKIVKI